MTFSIVARDFETGQLGVAVQSHWFSVGSLVSFARSGVGAVESTDPTYGIRCLNKLIQPDYTASRVLKLMLRDDVDSHARQIAIIDARGNVAVHTGSRCFPEAGHTTGEQFSCQANTMKNRQVWIRMKEAYLRGLKLPFAERMVSALRAGQKAGGDIRGQQSSSLLVVSSKRSRFPEMQRIIDLRVEDHPRPIYELSRLLRLYRAYEWARQAPSLMFRGEYDASAKAYDRAIRFAPLISELKFWKAVNLVSMGKLSESRKIFKSIARTKKEASEWNQLIRGLIEIGLFPSDTEILNQVFSL
jgi:uncharacterized Ntn-hydrolase superfamily protein